MTLASNTGITVAAAFSCQAFRFLETASRNSSCHCFSVDRAAFTRNASCISTDTLTRTFFNLDPFLFPSVFLVKRELGQTFHPSGFVHARHLEFPQSQHSQVLRLVSGLHRDLRSVQPTVQRLVHRNHRSAGELSSSRWGGSCHCVGHFCVKKLTRFVGHGFFPRKVFTTERVFEQGFLLCRDVPTHLLGHAFGDILVQLLLRVRVRHQKQDHATDA